MRQFQTLQSHQESQILLLVDMSYQLEYAQLQTLQLHLGHPVGKFQKLILEQGQEADLQLDQTVANSHIHKQVIVVFHTKVLGPHGLPLQVLHQGLEQMLLMQIVIQGQFLKQPVEVIVRQIGRMYLLVEMAARLKVQPVYTL